MKSYLLKKGIIVLMVTMIIFTPMWVKQVEAQIYGVPDKEKIEKARTFFKGKFIKFVVPWSPGGTYDGKARMMTPFLEKYLPGVKFLVVNRPGGGGIIGINETYVAKPDGLTIAIVTAVGMVANQVADTNIVKYDATKFRYLGRISAERRILVASNESKVKDYNSLMKADFPVKQSLTGPGSPSYTASQLVVKGLGFPYKEILGYPGTPETIMAIIRGEADITFSTEDSLIPAIERKDVRPILQLAPQDIKELGKIPNLLTEDAKKLGLTEVQLKRIRLAGDLMQLGRILVAPPGIPPERAWLLEEAVQKTLHNAEFAALCKQSGDARSLDPLTGKETAEIVSKFLNMSADSKAELQSLMKAK